MSSMIENHLKGISTPILKFNTNHFDFRNIDTVRKTIVPLISELDLKI